MRAPTPTPPPCPPSRTPRPCYRSRVVDFVREGGCFLGVFVWILVGWKCPMRPTPHRSACPRQAPDRAIVCNMCDFVRERGVFSASPRSKLKPHHVGGLPTPSPTSLPARQMQGRRCGGAWGLIGLTKNTFPSLPKSIQRGRTRPQPPTALPARMAPELWILLGIERNFPARPTAHRVCMKFGRDGKVFSASPIGPSQLVDFVKDGRYFLQPNQAQAPTTSAGFW